MSEFKIIGRPLKLSKKIDPFNRVNLSFEEKLKTADLIPVRFSVNLQQLMADQSNQTTPSASSEYLEMDFSEIDKYKKLCIAHGLPPKMGCRIYLSDETISQEDFSNNFKNNIFEDTFNKTADVFKSYTDSIRSLGGRNGSLTDSANLLGDFGQSEGSGVVSSLLKSISSLAGDGLQSIIDVVSNINKSPIGQTATNLLTKGSHISLPQIWDSSTYSPSLSMNVKLISPYGHDDAILKYVLEPLLYILLLACPTTNDGVTYGQVPYVKFRAYGVSDIHLGYINNVSIRRGGSDIVTNAESVPLMVDVTISIKPAFNAFAARIDSGQSNTAYVHPNSMLNGAEYLFETITSTTTKNRSTAINSLQNIVDSFIPLSKTNQLDNGGIQYTNVFTNTEIQQKISRIRDVLDDPSQSALDLINKIIPDNGTTLFSLLP